MRVAFFFGFMLLALPAGAQAPMAPRSVDQLRLFFAKNCVRCHGVDGSAHDAEGHKLRGKDFTDAKEMKGESDEDLEKTIRKGIFFGWAMPAFKKTLSETEIRTLVKDIVRKAEKGKPIAPPEPEGSKAAPEAAK